jgi:hypothetical protein
VADSQGWRWIYWWCTIFIGINIILFIFFYEETKFTFRTFMGTSSPASAAQTIDENSKNEDKKNPMQLTQIHSAGAIISTFQGINHSIPMKKLLAAYGLGD